MFAKKKMVKVKLGSLAINTSLGRNGDLKPI